MVEAIIAIGLWLAAVILLLTVGGDVAEERREERIERMGEFFDYLVDHQLELPPEIRGRLIELDRFCSGMEAS